MIDAVVLMLGAWAATADPICAREPVAGAVARYANAVKAQDIAGVAAFYGEHGVLIGGDGEDIAGSAAVARYMGRFSGFHVLAETMTVDGAAADGQGWSVTGRFSQQGTTPKGSGYAVAGSFQSRWSCDGGAWRIDRLAVQPDPAPAKR